MINKDQQTNEIWMDVLHKNTGTCRCVPFTSCHPKHCKTFCLLLQGIFAQFKLLLTAIPDTRLKELEKVPVNQEYPQSLMQKAINKALEIPISELRLLKTKKENDCFAFASVFILNDTNLFPTIRTTFQYIQEGNKIKVFSKYILIESQRQLPTLKNLTKVKYSNKA